MEESKKFNLEESMTELEEIVESLDLAEEPLEKLIEKFERGIKLAKEAQSYLDNAEQRIIDITKESDE